jgi:hypothetical protein
VTGLILSETFETLPRQIKARPKAEEKYSNSEMVSSEMKNFLESC